MVYICENKKCNYLNYDAEPVNDAYYVTPDGCMGGDYWVGDPKFKCKECGEESK